MPPWFARALASAVVALAAAQIASAEPRHATDAPDASFAAALYAAGDYIAAADAASADETSADALALAAKAYAAAAILNADSEDAGLWAGAARARAEQAVALDPDHVEGRLQLAVALWLESRRRGGLSAYWRGLPQRGRALVESVLDDHPDEPWAHALLGAWHFEALRRGGGWARGALGADAAQGAQAFNRALALDPDDAAIATQCAVAYLALDPDRFREHAAIALDHALTAPTRDAFEAAMQDRAREARRLMDAHDEAALRAVVLRWVEG